MKEAILCIWDKRDGKYHVNYGLNYGQFWIPESDIIIHSIDEENIARVSITEKQLKRISK